MRRHPRFWLYAALLLLPFWLYFYLSSHLELERFQLQQEHQFRDIPNLPTGPEAAAASLNYRSAAMDILWMGSILYTSEQLRLRRPARGMTAYADAIAYLDPNFSPIYYRHYAIAFDHLADPTLDDLHDNIRILEQGLQLYPHNWRLTQAYVLSHLRLFRQMEPHIALEGLESAHDVLADTISAGDPPPIATLLLLTVRRYKSDLRSQIDGTSTDDTIIDPVEIDFYIAQYFRLDEGQRERIRIQLAALGAEEDLLEQIDAYERDFRRVHLLHYPYLSSDLFTLVDVDLYLWHDADRL